MQIKNYPDFDLTYCTNIHPGESWQEVLTQLKDNIPELKSRISPERSFGVGLRLSAEAAKQLLKKDNLRQFKNWLEEEDLYVFTMNGFPYGGFHRQEVKDRVYAPDWRTEERVEYTLNLARILAELLPEGSEGGISTSPLSYKLWLNDSSDEEEVFQKGTGNLARVAHEMAAIYEEQGKVLHLDIEPEPDCLLENTGETIDFFTNRLFPEGSSYLQEKSGMGMKEAEELLKRHIRVCYDTCHFSVEYENPAETLQRFQQAGIRIGKTQISAALKVPLGEPGDRQKLAAELEAFEESTYLHQVIERRTDGSLHHYPDLSDALPNIDRIDAEEWRIHYHVPIFMESFDTFESTQDDIIRSLQLLIHSGDCRHFEIETYTWEVLPDDLKMDLTDSIEREIRWTLDLFDMD